MIVETDTNKLAKKGGYTSPSSDPMKGFIAVISATLILELISELLSIPVAWRLSIYGLSTFVLVWLLLIAACLFFLTMFVKKTWFWVVNIIVQLSLVAAGFIQLGIGILGIIFVILWAIIIWMGRKMNRNILTGKIYGQAKLS